MTQSSLLQIVALARAGATDLAWRRFREAGLSERRDDPAAVTLHGRLLKDRALAAAGGERLAAAREAADAYARAATLRRGAYPLINAATLSMVAGDRDRCTNLAREVLARLDSGEEEDSHYYLTATRAEALLLLDRVAEAESALSVAIAAAPRAWEDHATTLRQFGVILAETGQPSEWLDPLRPPTSLHFAGRMRLGTIESGLIEQIDRVISGDRVGFGYGALAAGADLLIAERLLAAGAEVHAVLPGGESRFRDRSVEPFGEPWRRRFDAVLSNVSSLRIVGDPSHDAFEASAALADDLAMGAAAMNAARLQSSAIQLLLDGGPATRRAGAVWADSGRRQHRLRVDPQPETALQSSPGITSAAALALSLHGGDTSIDGFLADVAPRLSLVEDVLSRLELIGRPHWDGHCLLIHAVSCAVAIDAIESLRTALACDSPLRIACEIGVVAVANGPLTIGVLTSGTASALARAILEVTPDGAVYLGEAMAASLASASVGSPRIEFVGELPGAQPVPLYALKR